MSTQRKRIIFWLSAGAVVTVLTFAGWWLHEVNQVLKGKAPVSCDEAARFLAAAHPPETARNKKCTVGQWQTTWYNIDFQTSRAEAEAWLRSTYPDATVSRDCVEAGLCAYPAAPADGSDNGNADYLSVHIRFEDSDSAHVNVSGGTST
ncbi:hypothetical protein ABT144_14670 [Streptomyces sp. NPDC002039]|uniref:hypothetical protein n=1 Tax=Streptomyces sp. NPDC002039 TaxID=3154660 RepID=UPI00332F65D8